MQKEELITVFEDTKSQVVEGKIASIASTEKFDSDNIDYPIVRGYKTEVSIENMDTVSAAKLLCLEGKTALLNMASAKKPGGGVRNGARAQEECLFRCSDLFNTVPVEFYPLALTEGLYTKDAIFFKDKDYNNIEPFKVDVVTVAAINLNPDANPDNIGDYFAVTTNKIRFILQLANENEVENLVLGAWGCGVFKNNPKTIAELFMTELKRHKGCFKKVVFAVINDHNSVANNFDIFKEVIEYRNLNF